jgi:outer membrane protein assembly factor BamB
MPRKTAISILPPAPHEGRRRGKTDPVAVARRGAVLKSQTPYAERFRGIRPGLDRPPCGAIRTNYADRQAYLVVLRGAAATLAIFLGFLAAAPSQADPAADPAAESELYFGSHLPADRGARRSLGLARQLLTENRPSDAAPLLDGLLAATEDSVEEDGRSLRRAAAAIVSSLGPPERAAYELCFAHEAGKLTNQAIASRDAGRLAAIAARFPPTLLGRDAWLAWAELEADRGNYASAASIARRVLAADSAESDSAASDFARTLVAVNARRAGVSTGDRDPRIDDVWRDDTQAGADAYAATRRPAQWLGSGGDADRSPSAPATAPFAWRSWRAELVDDAAPRDRLALLAGSLSSEGGANLVASGAIAVDGVIVSPTAGGLVAIDAESGRRLWRTVSAPTDAELEPSWAWNDTAGASLADPLAQRAWLDRTRGSITSDGRVVLAVAPAPREHRATQAPWGLNRRGAFGESAEAAPANALCAYDLSRDGKLVWRLDGSEAGSLVEGAYFLAAPTPFEGRLWALAEIEQTVVLLEIDAASGAIRWRQSLATLERGVADSPAARMLGAAPTIDPATGTVYCPTGGGMLVAIDPWARSILWNARSRVERDDLREADRRGWTIDFGASVSIEGGRGWREPRAVVAGDAVAMVSHESPRLTVVDAATGDERWAQRIDDGLLLAAARDGALLVIESRGVSAWSLAGGKRRWRTELPAAESPAGEGLLLEAGGAAKSYLLPLASGRVALFEFETGTLEVRDLGLDPFDAAPDLGVTFSHRGALFFRGATRIERYEQTTGDRSATEFGRAVARLEGVDPNSPSRPADGGNEPALARVLAIGDLVAATRTNRGATESPVRVEGSLPGLATRRTLAALRFRAWLASGDAERTIEAAINSARLGGLIAIDRDHSVAAPRWVAGELLRVADNELRKRLDKRALAVVGEANGVDRLATLAKALVGSPAGAAALDELANRADRRNDPVAANRLRWMASRAAGEPAAEQKATRSPFASEQVSATLFVDATRQPRRPPSAAWQRRINEPRESGGESPLALRVVDPIAATPVAWRVRRDQSERRSIVGLNGRGERMFFAELPEVVAPHAQQAGVGFSSEWHAGPVIVQRVGERVVTHACDSSGNGSPLWTSSAEDDWRRHATTIDPRTIPRILRAPSAAARGDQPLAVGPLGVVISSERGIECRDTLTGAPQWRRADLTRLGRALAVNDRLYAWDPEPADNTSEPPAGVVLSAIDGVTLGDWDPPSGTWLSAAGRHVLVARNAAEGRVYALINLESGSEVWSSPPGVLGAAVRDAARGDGDTGLFAVLGEDRELLLIDVARGAPRFGRVLPAGIKPTRKRDADAESPAVELTATIDGDRLYATVSYRDEAAHRAAGAVRQGGPLVTGELHALDATTGAPLWPQPAELDGVGPLDVQLRPLPVLLMASRKVQAAPTGEYSRTSLLVLDAATGRTLYRNDALPAAISPLDTPWAIRETTVAGGERVVLHLGEARLSLESTGEPRPPRPPFVARVETPPPQPGSDLIDVGRDLGKFLEQMIVPSR